MAGTQVWGGLTNGVTDSHCFSRYPGQEKRVKDVPNNYQSFNIFAYLRKRVEELIIKAVDLSSILIVIVTVIFNT